MASYDLTRIPALRDLQELGRRQKNVTDGLGQRNQRLRQLIEVGEVKQGAFHGAFYQRQPRVSLVNGLEPESVEQLDDVFQHGVPPYAGVISNQPLVLGLSPSAGSILT